jgi:hypothetical protein
MYGFFESKNLKKEFCKRDDDGDPPLHALENRQHKIHEICITLDKQIAEEDFWADEEFNESFLDEHVGSKLDIEQAALI